MVLDLTEEEQACVNSTVHISIDKSGNIRGIVKEGHGELSLGHIASMLSVSKDAGSQIFGSLHRKIVHYKVVRT
jgi:exosome complex RNA-binding protein Rrp42 (RNase PH superfamily)